MTRHVTWRPQRSASGRGPVAYDGPVGRPGSAIAWLLAFTLVACAGVAAARGWWLSGVGALVAAGLLWRGHPRARFATYVLLTVVAVRAALAGSVVVVVLAVAAVLALQTPSARA
ncbi:MAG TPA: hypothetical protein VNL18_09160, partial [Gemmatimonadales bacterium]|nr:hypothetical protein [Gemmatimonadales bacterium]